MMSVCWFKFTLLGLHGFHEFYFADLLLSLFIFSRLACCVMFDVTSVSFLVVLV